MPSWILPFVVTAYLALVTVTSLAAGFSASPGQCATTLRVLRVLLPAGLLDALAQVALSGITASAAPSWVLPLAVLTYLGLVLLSGASAGFSSDADRREANFQVLRTLVPWTVCNITGQILVPLLAQSLF